MLFFCQNGVIYLIIDDGIITKVIVADHTFKINRPVLAFNICKYPVSTDSYRNLINFENYSLLTQMERKWNSL